MVLNRYILSMYWNDMKESIKSSSSFTMNCMEYIIIRGANKKKPVQNNKQGKEVYRINAELT